MTEPKERSGLRRPFVTGFSAGLITLVIWFVVRLGGLAPFPPESALVSFFSVIPESIQEPAVQALGEAAGLLGLGIATIVAAAVYGLLGIVYERYYLKRAAAVRKFSRLERTLAYSLVPWLFFGVVVLPLSGESFFGMVSNLNALHSAWIYPLTILLIQLLWGLLLWSRTPTSSETLMAGASLPEGTFPKDPTRRTFIERATILAGSAILVIASLGSALGTIVSEGGLFSQGGTSILPGTSINLQNAPPIFKDSRLADLVNSEVTDNGAFYRVAIDIFDPSVDASTWSLALNGLVASPKTYSLADIQKLTKVQQYTTFICVSNLINGGLISNAKWGGAKFSDIFADAGGVPPNARYVVFHSVDGYSVGVPLSKALEPESMLAYEMNGAPLSARHGYPLRAVIPGLYGMMSAKWIRQIELSDTVYLGYWQTRRWSNDATIQTAVFVRIPQDGATVSLSQNNGSVMIGGVAFAGDRGISRVEVSVDGGGTWQQATLKPPVSNLTWVLWAYEWRPQGPGQYVIYARATDGNGVLQTSVQADPYPAGATGYVMSTLKVVS